MDVTRDNSGIGNFLVGHCNIFKMHKKVKGCVMLMKSSTAVSSVDILIVTVVWAIDWVKFIQDNYQNMCIIQLEEKGVETAHIVLFN